jgi:pimeloyl-ACP methyl ester carboxylesterase
MHIDIDDLQLHYDLHGQGEPLLWLHGGMGHGPDWQYVFKTPPDGYQLSTCFVSSITSGSVGSR